MTSGDTPPPGLVAGKYQLVRLIGRGGMGSVWEARNAAIGARFAIKFIESDYVDSQEARGRFIKEARAAATIDSKHLIRIYDHGYTEDGRPFLVMELLEGEPLDKRLERGPMPLDEMARVLQQVCRGLARAHERGIIHRDLKPENIFLVRTPDDDHEIAKVLDFGIAKIQSSEHNPSVTSSTKTGAVIGTPFYMSPEQARGLRNVDHRTDLWSIGVIAFRCLTGKLPFDGESVGDLLVKICTAPLPVPSQVMPGLPPAFDAWFAKALEREPDRRFQTCAELSDALGATAGIAPRGAGTPLSSVAVVSGPYGAAQGPHVTGPTVHAAGQGTPHPAAMTASPFTSAVPGVPAPGRAKYVALAALAGLLVAAGGSAAVYAAKQRPTHAMGIAPTPPATSAPATDPTAAPSPATPAEPPTEPTAAPAIADKKVEPVAKAGAAPAKAGVAPAKPAPAGKTAPTPPKSEPTTKAEPAASTAPALPPPAKKPPPPPKPKDDPGY